LIQTQKLRADNIRPYNIFSLLAVSCLFRQSEQAVNYSLFFICGSSSLTQRGSFGMHFHILTLSSAFAIIKTHQHMGVCRMNAVVSGCVPYQRKRRMIYEKNSSIHIMPGALCQYAYNVCIGKRCFP